MPCSSENTEPRPHRFIICRGDTVQAYFSKDKLETGTVAGISHKDNQIRVRFQEGTAGQWFYVGQIYPAQEPPHAVNAQEPSPPESVDAAEGSSGTCELPVEKSPFTIDDHTAFRRKVKAGTITATELKTEFTRMLESKELFIAQLASRFNAKQLQYLSSTLGNWGASRQSKEENAKDCCRAVLQMFAIGTGSFRCSPFSGETLEDAIAKSVAAITDESLHEYFAARERKEQAAAKALENPETDAEFRTFIREKGEDALTDEQRARLDGIVADRAREERSIEKAPETVSQIESEGADGLELTITEGYHSKREIPLFVVQMSERVDRATYKELLGKAKMLGGWYSSFVKSQAGFQFTTRESAEKFCLLLSADANREEELVARRGRKLETAADNLTYLAEGLERKAEETLLADKDKSKNTVRRSEMAASVRYQAYADQALARTMRSVATALEAGEARYVDGVRTKAAMSDLLFLLRRSKTNHIQHKIQEARKSGTPLGYAEEQSLDDRPVDLSDIRYAKYPYPRIYRPELERMYEWMKNRKGCIQASRRFRKRYLGTAGEFLAFKESYQVTDLKDFLSRAQAAEYETKWLKNSVQSYDRLRRANIHTVEELRCALRELLPHTARQQRDDPIQKAEAELIGVPLPGFFPTPGSVIRQMLERADVQPGHTVLEPSCGKGDIIDAIKDECPDAKITAIEFNRTLQHVLEAKGHEVQFTDFLQHSGQYDRILMNPPFESGADIDHVMHAYDCLAEGGRLVAIMSEGPFFRSDRKAEGFRAWLDTVGGSSEELPEDAFQAAEAFRQTGVRTRIVEITK